jgi:hypothetical protein
LWKFKIFKVAFNPAKMCVSYFEFVNFIQWGMSYATFSMFSIWTLNPFAKVEFITSIVTDKSFIMFNALMADATFPVFQYCMMTRIDPVRLLITPRI